jgi:hypothetical protein
LCRERRTPIHPDTKTLLAYRDGELARGRSVKAALHLAHCGQCRRELTSIQTEARQFDADQASPRLEEGFARLLAAARRIQLAHRDTLRSKIRERVAAQLEMLLGSGAVTIQKAASTRQDGPGALAAAEPLLSAFLGQKAAALLASRLLDGVDLSGHVARERAS